jgi:DNA polymerase-3 subunit beta|nr:DNA polymerase III subunit beta [uncultured Sphingomonas sp.]
MTTIAFETDKLNRALREVRATVQRRNTIPILANVLVEAEAGMVRLTASDLDVMVTLTVPAVVERPISFTLDAHRLADVVGSFGGGSQTAIKFDGSAATVSNGRARFRFTTLPKDQFPILKQEVVQARFTLESKALARALAVVRHAVSTEEVRYYLNGVFLHPVDGSLRFASCDGNRLARYIDELPAGAEAMSGTILRTRCIDLVQSAAEAREAAINVVVGDGKVTMAAGDFLIVAKVVEGQYPDYARTIPAPSSTAITIDRDALHETVARLAMVSSDKVRSVRFDLSRDMLRVSTTSPEHGEAVDEVPCEYAGQPLTVSFNSRYLREALAAVDVDHVDISLNGEQGAVLITSPKADGVSLVLMPLKPIAV